MARAGLSHGWRCLLANDICPKKAAAYVENWGDHDLIIRDVAAIKLAELRQHADLAWASFPCQDLSLAGNGDGLQGERSGTFWGFWRQIKALARACRKPRVIVLENVYGTLTSHDGKDFEAIAKALVTEGYVFGAMVIDGVQFVPQSRPRMFIVAIDSNLGIPQELLADRATPTWHPDGIIRTYNRLPKKLKDAWKWWAVPVPQQRIQTIEDIVEEVPSGVQWHSCSETQKLMMMMTPINREKVISAQATRQKQVGTIYKRTRLGIQRAEVRFDGVSGCLRTPGGGSSRQTIMIVDGPIIRTRLLSPREAARLMGLPDEYRLPLKYNDAYMLAGDGVIVPVVRHLAQHLIEPLVDANIAQRRAAA